MTMSEAQHYNLEIKAKRLALIETKEEMKADLVSKRPEKVAKMRSLRK